MKKVKIAHLSSAHPPFDIRILHKECKTLAQAGYEVVLVVPHDQSGTHDEVRISAVPKAGSRRQRMARTAWEVYRAALAEDAHIYHFHDPELIPVSLLLKLHGKRVIYDVHEDLPRQMLTKPWIPRWLRGIVAEAAELIESVAVGFFDGIVAATPVIARRFPQAKTVTVQNFPILGEITPRDSLPYGERAPLVVYPGGITVVQGIREMVRAMALLPESLGANLILAGVFESSELQTEVQQMPGWERVAFLGWQHREGVVRLLQEGRLGLVLDHPIPNYVESYSTKLFEYMAVGIPVVASDFPLWREIIDGAGCGLLVDPLNPQIVADAIQWLLTHTEEAEAMGKRGREAVHTRYNWDKEAESLLTFYRRVIP